MNRTWKIRERENPKGKGKWKVNLMLLTHLTKCKHQCQYESVFCLLHWRRALYAIGWVLGLWGKAHLNFVSSNGPLEA